MTKPPPPPVQVRLGGLKLYRSGQVLDLFELPAYPHFLLVLASNSVTGAGLPANCRDFQQGELKTAFNVYWKLQLLKLFHLGIATDLVAFGPQIDRYLPHTLHSRPDLYRRATVVRKLQPVNPHRTDDHLRNCQRLAPLLLALQAKLRGLEFLGAELRFGHWARNKRVYLMGDAASPSRAKYGLVHTRLAELPPLPWTEIDVQEQRRYIRAIARAHHEVFTRLSGRTLADFQREVMKIESD